MRKWWTSSPVVLVLLSCVTYSRHNSHSLSFSQSQPESFRVLHPCAQVGSCSESSLCRKKAHNHFTQHQHACSKFQSTTDLETGKRTSIEKLQIQRASVDVGHICTQKQCYRVPRCLYYERVHAFQFLSCKKWDAP